MDALKENLEKNEYDHIGSALLWQNHKKALDEMYIRIDEFDIEKVGFSALYEFRSIYVIYLASRFLLFFFV